MKKEQKLIGGHISFKKPDYLLGAVLECIKIKATTAAIFVGAPQSKERVPLDHDLIKEAHELAKKNNVSIENFIVHAPYLANLASSNPSNWNFSVNLIITDVKRTDELGIKFFNIHPGSNPNQEEGIKNVAKAINKIHSKTKNVIILLETVTAKGNLLGKTFDEMKAIIDLIEDKKRIGVCMDTVHMWDAGYDIKNGFDGILLEFDKKVGLKYLKGMHIGDSKNENGSNKDRHENIGKGKIGLQAIKYIVNHPKIDHLPMVLETPWDPKHHYENEIKILLEKD